MYRYSVDNAVTYTSEDFVLFREAPFACWMERLTLENPDHGIPADSGSVPPCASIERQDDMADTLLEEGKDVRLVDWDADEASRRSATLDAMRAGADFIVNGQLALGPLSGAANLLVRTSGYSELGDFLYIPCETQSANASDCAFRLSFLADLLHSLQGQLPPQMLIIRGGDDLVPLQTEDHIYHYRAVKQRFMESMRGFRKHRMPDPAESAHFGRWSDCAHEVLKQRLMREESAGQQVAQDYLAEPRRETVAAAAGAAATGYDLSGLRPQSGAGAVAAESAPASIGAPQAGAAPDLTLAEQARILEPGTYKPGPGVYRLGPPRSAPSPRREVAPAAELAQAPAAERPPITLSGFNGGYAEPETTPAAELDSTTLSAKQPAAAPKEPLHNRRASDAALQNLEFIGREQHYPGAGLDTAPAVEIPPAETAAATAADILPPGSTAPAPSLRGPRVRVSSLPSGTTPQPPVTPPPVLQPLPEFEAPVEPPAASSAIDRDDTYPASPPPRLTTSDAPLPEGFPLETLDVPHNFGQQASDIRKRDRAAPPSDKIFIEEAPLHEGSFSNSLITSDELED